MIGLGVDLCEISRIEKTLEKGDSFLNRYYAPSEREWLSACGAVKAQSAAAMFAAKEALLKALGVGLSGGAAMNEIAVEHDESGCPRYALTGAAARLLRERGAKTAYLSLTHEAGMACAVCVIE